MDQGGEFALWIKRWRVETSFCTFSYEGNFLSCTYATKIQLANHTLHRLNENAGISIFDQVLTSRDL